MQQQQTIPEFIQALAERTPTPGGGAAAAVAAQMGIALLLMVIRFTRGKPRAKGHEQDLDDVERALLGHLELAGRMGERDRAAFERVMTAYQIPEDDGDGGAVRSRAVDEALIGAIVVPEEMMCVVRDALAAMEKVAGCVGRNIVSDLGAASGLLRAAFDTALGNVRINASFLSNQSTAGAALERAAAVRIEVGGLLARMNSVVDIALR